MASIVANEISNAKTSKAVRVAKDDIYLLPNVTAAGPWIVSDKLWVE